MKLRTKRVEKKNYGSGGRDSGRPPFDKMEAIAIGVQARLEESTRFSRKVTDETVKTARALGVTNAVIERWAAWRLNRLALESERLREIRSLLQKVYWHTPRTTLS